MMKFLLTFLLVLLIKHNIIIAAANKAGFIDQEDSRDLTKSYKNVAYPDGYKQVNTILSEAFMNLIRDGTYVAICNYNAGIAPPPGVDRDEICRGGLANPDDCTRTWDRSEEPQGILKKAIRQGTFKWCVGEDSFGPVEEGFIGIAKEDYLLQNIKKGDLYGTEVDYYNALTIAMSKILHAPLASKLVTVKSGSFDDMLDALSSNKCYATLDWFYRHPYREAKADFTCATYVVGQLDFSIVALESSKLDLEAIYSDQGKGIKVCSSTGSTQTSLAERDLPEADFVDVEVVGNFAKNLCSGECDVVVDETRQIQDSMLVTEECADIGDIDILSISAPSSATDVGAITYRYT